MDMDYNKKVPFYRKLLGFIFKDRKKEQYREYVYEKPSVFEEILEDVNENDENYEDVKLAATICDEILRIAKQKLILIRRTKNTQDKLNEYEYLTKLTDDDLDQLKIYIDSYMGLVKDRNILMYQITSFSNVIGHISKIEKEAKDIVVKMEDAEKNKSILRRDLSYLEGEKFELKDEEELLRNGLEFIKKFSLGVLLTTFVYTIFLWYKTVFLNQQIFYNTAIMVVFIIFIITFVTIIRNKIVKDLQLNIKMQNKAQKLLNKKNSVYVYYTNFLKFTYDKYRVSSSKMLKNSLKELNHYKRLARRVDAVRKAITAREYDIEEFLELKGVPKQKNDILEFAETMKIEDKRRHLNELSKEKDEIDATLEDLDVQHETMWGALMQLQEDDKTQKKIITEIVKAYYYEIDKLTKDVDKDTHRK